MKFVVDGTHDGVVNMARDVELRDQADQGEFGCRVYFWSGPWVTLGRFQSAPKDLIDPTAIEWIVRPTGGKAVLHGHDVTVGLAAPLAQIGCSSRELKRAYRALILPLVSALRECAVPCVLAEGTIHESKGIRTSDCFAFNSANDVVDEITGIKVCGCALQLTETSVLLQASIPYTQPLVDPSSVIREAAPGQSAEWDPQGFPEKLELALRYNLVHV